MYQDLIIMFGIIFFIYKLITHKGELSLARIIYTFSLVLGLGIFFLRNLISPFTMLFWWIFCMGISLIGMYYIPSSENYDAVETQKHQKLFKGALYSWLFLVALYIYLYVLTYY